MDAVTGRFVSVDPLAVAPPELMLSNPQLIHPYAYAGNNPIIYLDTDGKMPRMLITAGARAVRNRPLQSGILALADRNRERFARIGEGQSARQLASNFLQNTNALKSNFVRNTNAVENLGAAAKGLAITSYVAQGVGGAGFEKLSSKLGRAGQWSSIGQNVLKLGEDKEQNLRALTDLAAGLFGLVKKNPVAARISQALSLENDIQQDLKSGDSLKQFQAGLNIIDNLASPGVSLLLKVNAAVARDLAQQSPEAQSQYRESQFD